jgi:hypothetical protein
MPRLLVRLAVSATGQRRLDRRRGLSLLAAAAAALTLTGCLGLGDDDGDSGADNPEPPAVEAPRSTHEALDRLARWIRAESPTAITAYDRDLVENVGRGRMLEALRVMRSPFSAARRRVIDVDETPLGEQVTVRHTPKGTGQKDAQARDFVYVLDRRGEETVITYDGQLSETLAANAGRAATERVQRRARSRARRASPAAQAAGALASARVQRNVLRGLRPLPDAPRESRARTPRAALDRLWRWIRIGSPVAITAYDRPVVRKIGRTDLLMALQALRQPLEMSSLKITDVEGTRIGTLAVVEQKQKLPEPESKEGSRKQPTPPPVEVSYVLAKRRGGWIVDYDGLLAERLVALAIQDASAAVDQRSDPDDKEPSLAAKEAGAAAGERERGVVDSLVPSELQQRVTRQPQR